ncbi:MAG: 3'(2'),5'-bisphosphate nucleotidase CysQ [Pseudomonadota bacterium]
MPESDLELLTAAAQAAGQIASDYAAGENRVWSKGADDPVSDADLAVNQYLHDFLRAARPSYGWLSEESEDDPSRCAANRVFVVDPIDGTRAFVAGEATWAHSLAVVEHGRPVTAVVYLPMKDKLYSAQRGGGARKNGQRITATRTSEIADATLLASRPALDPKHWHGSPPEVTRVFRPSIAYRICLVAEGRYDGMLTIRETWEWDSAGGALIAAEAGAVVSDGCGAALRFNNPHPTTQGILVAGAALHQKLADRLACEPVRNGP